ncbi:MAG: hypothetical protein HXS53_11865 [Theionarchaea archaeon]|nr:hypothetical protein [Theionarchaea archaeon]
MVKYGEAEWRKKIMLLPEERILLNPLDPIYKELLTDASYEERDVIQQVSSRFEHPSQLYLPPEKDVLYTLFPLVAIAKKGSHSREASLVVSMICSIIRERLEYALDNEKIVNDVLDSMSGIVPVKKLHDVSITIPREDAFRLCTGDDQLSYVIHWTALSEYNLTQYYITGGWIPLTTKRLIEVYILLLEKSLRTYIDEKRTEYTSQNLELPPLFSALLHSISSKVPAVTVAPVGATEFDEESFPPCIREALAGTGAGLRNYAITVLLTSFLSYARVYPSLSAFDQEKKPDLSADQIEILLHEVVPLIIEAGDRCDPPFFADQPIEKLNVFYHLGFGLNGSPGHGDFGQSKWYLPPSCKKIKQNAPSLCKPDALCSQGIYVISNKDKFNHLVDINDGDPLRVLLALTRYRNPEEIVTKSGVDEGEVRRILKNLEREEILIQIRVRNPLVYYVRKLRQKQRKKRNKDHNSRNAPEK